MIYLNTIYAIYLKVHRLDPNNKEIQPILVRLHKAVSQKVNVLIISISYPVFLHKFDTF